ncbi:alpha/beta hydrolase [Streptomyces sp. Z26]|uniref:alpha/beta fold hydrolase n=1 Tax=Streptomyces sp. Z26 TaxID=2500177 RepID=UPI000EF1306D|nr:alpha/beta hydrolase [Streptomyces sp. Z26]RLL67629.1 alpha/beta hydrolase [Streptomyces sp. Z26]
MNATLPRVVLVHGAFSDSSGFARLSTLLDHAHIPHVAAPNPLRGLHTDAAAIGAVVEAIDGPVVLVGHSYGGAVISQAAANLTNVTGLVYLAGFALEAGESVMSSQHSFPPSLIGKAARPTPYEAHGSAGGPDVYLATDLFPEVVAADLPAEAVAVMAASQRPIAHAALTEPATAAAWHTIPSWYLLAGQDRALVPEAQAFMADRMNATTASVLSSHAVHIAHPEVAVALIREATERRS